MNFIAAGIDAAESPDVLRAYKETQGYPWQVVTAGRETLERYNVVSTAIKYGIDRRDTIIFHGGYGVMEETRWRQLFEDLASR